MMYVYMAQGLNKQNTQFKHFHRRHCLLPYWYWHCQ